MSASASREVVRGVDLRIAPGEVVGLVGESGSGKSMTALAIMRLLPPGGAVTSGRVLFRGQDLRACSASELNRLRGSQIGMIFQDPLTALNPALSIGRQLTDTIRTHQPLGRRAATATGRGTAGAGRHPLSAPAPAGLSRTNCPAACASG